jgi:hypothetical protein
MRDFPLYLAAIAVLLCWPVGLCADGFVIGKRGQYIPEEEQRAFIEWKDGQERLFVTTRSGAAADATLWIVPVPARPESVQAEPVERFPRIPPRVSVAKEATKRLDNLAMWCVCLDGGVPLVAIALQGENANATFSFVGVKVHQHIEKLGMVVELLTAQSTEALDRYLADKKFDVRAANIAALAPYLREEYTLVCSWVAVPSQKMTARAVRIDFPSAGVFYPLRPTRLNESDMATTICIRGWMRPQAGLTLPGLRCRYVQANVSEAPLGEKLPPLPDSKGHDSSEDEPLSLLNKRKSPEDEPLTLVELSNSPQDWTQDLVLEPGAPAAVYVAQAINSLGAWPMLVVPGVCGVVLATFLPWVIIPREKRRWFDWPWAWGVGISTCLTILISACVFYAWCRVRKPMDRQTPLGRFSQYSLLIGGGGILTLLGAIFLHQDVSSRLLDILLGAAVVLSIAFSLAAISMTYDVVRRKGWWLALFTVLHLGTIVGLCVALRNWLAAYA